MVTDVKLSGQQVRVEAWDLVLDAKDRRSAPNGDRRAFVHDLEDGLTINWGSDYPGGVTCNGNVRFPSGHVRVEKGRLEIKSLTHVDDGPIWTDALRVSDQLILTTRVDLSEPTGQAIRRIVPGKPKLPGGSSSTAASAGTGVLTVEEAGHSATVIPLSALGLGDIGDIDDVASTYNLPTEGAVNLEIDVGMLILQLFDRVIELGREVKQLQAKANG